MAACDAARILSVLGEATREAPACRFGKLTASLCFSFSQGPLKRPLERFICDRMIRGGLQATDLLDDVLNSQSPFA
jgi:hypothetical protein